MEANENWDEEFEGSGSGKDDPQAQAQASGDDAAIHEDHMADTKTSPEAKEYEGILDGGGKAKRAQRTRRMKLPGTAQGANQGSAQNASSQSAHGKPVSGNQPTNPRPGKVSNPPATPIQIPPQVNVAFQNGDGIEEDFPREEEPSKILAGLYCVAGGVVNALHGFWHLVKGLVQMLGKFLFTPALIGTLLYLTLVYAIVIFLVDRNNLSHLHGFEGAFRYIMGNIVWIILPMCAGFLATNFNGNTRHQQFMYESTIDAVIMAGNSWAMSVHATPDYLIWLGPVYVVSCLFRFVYWVSLFHLQPKWQQIFRMPTLLNVAIMTTYNLGWTLEAYSGCLMGDSKDATSVTPVDVTQTHEPVVHDQATPGQEAAGLFVNPSMCDLVERIFCKVDQTQ